MITKNKVSFFSDVLLHFCGHAPECLEFGNQKGIVLFGITKRKLHI